LVTCHLGERSEVAHLIFKVGICATKPEALMCATVNPQRSSDRIAIPAGLQGIVLGEDLDAFPLPALLHWYA
jgi:hypothetical protein